MKYFIIFFLLIISAKIFSQDTIYKINGERILAKVLEITPSEIKFSKTGLFPTAAAFTENKGDVQVIVFNNGAREDFGKTKFNSFPKEKSHYYGLDTLYTSKKIRIKESSLYYQGNKISEHEMNLMLLNTKDNELMTLAARIKKKQKWQYLSLGAFPCAMVTLALGYNNSYFSNLPNSNAKATANTFAAIFGAGILACPMIGFSIAENHNTLKNKAIKLYNQKY